MSKQEINLLNDGPKASVHARTKSYDDVADKKQIGYCTKTNDDINPSPLASEDITNLANGKDPDSHMDTPPKICLREKKRQREQIQQQRQSLFSDKASWRTSSTSILDDLYKDIARSIPTIDDVIFSFWNDNNYIKKSCFHSILSLLAFGFEYIQESGLTSLPSIDIFRKR